MDSPQWGNLTHHCRCGKTRQLLPDHFEYPKFGDTVELKVLCDECKDHPDPEIVLITMRLQVEVTSNDPEETRLDKTKRVLQDVLSQGINPFDLMSWPYLMNLVAMVKEGEGILDLDVYVNTKKLLTEALLNKAKDKDEDEGVFVYSDLAKAILE